MNGGMAADTLFPEPRRSAGPRGRGALVSVAVHGLALLALAARFEPPRADAPPVTSLEVEVVTAETPAVAAMAPSPAPIPAAPPSAIPPAATHPREERPASKPGAEDAGLIRPSRMLSAAVLADPRSRTGRAMLARLAVDERIEQLCGLEAMAQIHAWRKTLDPDRVVSYAMADTRRDGRTLVADGAAFHSGGLWYRLVFVCGLSADFDRVASFGFRVGHAIPRREWAGHALTGDEGPLD